jgi:hypothetical protein
MTVKELKEKIKDLPDNLDVFISQNNDEFEFSLLNGAVVGELPFSDDDLKASEDCLLLRD